MDRPHANTRLSLVDAAIKQWDSLCLNPGSYAGDVIAAAQRHAIPLVDLLPVLVHEASEINICIHTSKAKRDLDAMLGMAIKDLGSRPDIAADIDETAKAIVHDRSVVTNSPDRRSDKHQDRHFGTGFTYQAIADRLSRISPTTFAAAVISGGIGVKDRIRDLTHAFIEHPDAAWPIPPTYLSPERDAWVSAISAIARRKPLLGDKLRARADAEPGWRQACVAAHVIRGEFVPQTHYAASDIDRIAMSAAGNIHYAESVARAVREVNSDNTQDLLKVMIPIWSNPHMSGVIANIVQGAMRITERAVEPMGTNTADLLERWRWFMTIADGINDQTGRTHGISIAARHFNHAVLNDMPKIGSRPKQISLTQAIWASDILCHNLQSCGGNDITCALQFMQGRRCISPGSVSDVITGAALDGIVPTTQYPLVDTVSAMGSRDDRAVLVAAIGLRCGFHADKKAWPTDRIVYEREIRHALTTPHASKIMAIAMRVAMDPKPGYHEETAKMILAASGEMSDRPQGATDPSA